MKKKQLINSNAKYEYGIFTCPCCGYKVVEEDAPGWYGICPICFWEDDPHARGDPDFKGGANHGVSLRQAQKNFVRFGACERSMISNVRKATPEDERDPDWKGHLI